jgi:NitT/TauT family transport system substrate-binding protein
VRHDQKLNVVGEPVAVVLQETLRAVFYAPFYAAFALGAYDKEGVEVSFKSSPRPSEAALGVLDGSVDVTWGGPLRVIKTREERPDSDLVCFCEVVTRDPFFLVGRAPRPNFAIADLANVRLATVSEVPTPWLCLQEDIRRSGRDPDSIRRVAGQTMAENVAMMRRGEIDVVQLFEPLVEELLTTGIGNLWYAAADRGLTSYTTFYARRDVITARHEEFRSLVRAIYRVQKWLHQSTAAEITQVVAGFFPTVSEIRLAAAIDRYKRLGVWSKNPRLTQSGYQRLRQGMISGGFVRVAAQYEEAVENSLAEEVIRDDPPAWPNP